MAIKQGGKIAPAPHHFQQMTVIGVGLIGGSLGLTALRKRLVRTVVGYGKRRGDLQRAITTGAIDRYFLTIQRAVEEADFVVLATPLGTFEKVLHAMLPHLKVGTIVTDVGSCKGKSVEKWEAMMPPGVFFIGGHPIAGRERSGVEAATIDLFAGHRCILTPTAKTPPHVLQKVRAFWEAIGATVFEMDPLTHDRIMGAVSHLPHLVAYALMETLCHPSVAQNDPVRFSAGGLRDFTRIAASSPEMWRDIFLANSQNVTRMIDLYIQTLEVLKKKISAEDGEALMEIFARAGVIRQKALS
jgi:prephenate dehydrogenase